MKPVLFASQRNFDRAENIKAVYNAYQGPKQFTRLNLMRYSTNIDYRNYDLMVTDEMPSCTPGKCIMIGHGANGLKKFGFDQPLPYVHHDERGLITKAVCASESVRELTAKAYGMNVDDVLPLGMPRTDALINNKQTTDTHKRVYLFAPTYRTAEEMTGTITDWRFIDGQLTDDETIIYKPHMLTGEVVACGLEHIVTASPNVPSEDYIRDCTALVTDYSSIMFDAMLAGKPVVLFAKDAEHYRQNRGFYFDYPSTYCSRRCDNERDLLSLLRQADTMGVTDIDVLDFFVGACDGHSTDRVVELIEVMNRGA